MLKSVYNDKKRNVVCLNAPQAAHCDLIMALYGADGDTVHWWFVQTKRYTTTPLTVRDFFFEVGKMGNTQLLPLLAYVLVSVAEGACSKALSVTNAAEEASLSPDFRAIIANLREQERDKPRSVATVWWNDLSTTSFPADIEYLQTRLKRALADEAVDEPTACLLQSYGTKAQVHYAIVSTGIPDRGTDLQKAGVPGPMLISEHL